MSDQEKNNDTPPAPAPETPAPENAPDAKDQEIATLRDRLLRLQADFDNFRRRTQREKAEWTVSANEGLLKDLLPVIDHFELGLKNATDLKADKAVHDGFQIVYDQWLAALKRVGFVPLDVQGSGFDPVHHEAVAHVPSDEYPADEIVAQTRRGWKLGEKLLRPVQVVVSSGPGALRDDESAGEQKAGA